MRGRLQQVYWRAEMRRQSFRAARLSSAAASGDVQVELGHAHAHAVAAAAPVAEGSGGGGGSESSASPRSTAQDDLTNFIRAGDKRRWSSGQPAIASAAAEAEAAAAAAGGALKDESRTRRESAPGCELQSEIDERRPAKLAKARRPDYDTASESASGARRGTAPTAQVSEPMATATVAAEAAAAAAAEPPEDLTRASGVLDFSTDDEDDNEHDNDDDDDDDDEEAPPVARSAHYGKRAPVVRPQTSEASCSAEVRRDLYRKVAALSPLSAAGAGDLGGSSLSEHLSDDDDDEDDAANVGGREPTGSLAQM